MGVCAITNSADIAPSALGWGRDGNNTFAVFLSCYRPQTGSVALWMITIKEHSARFLQLRHGCPLSRTCRVNATKSPHGLFKEISPKRNFFQGEPQSDCNRREGSPSLRLRRKFTRSCALKRKGSFALCGARVGAPPRHPASLREGLTQALFLGAHQNLRRHYGMRTRAFPSRGRGTA